MCPYKKTKITNNRPEWMTRELMEFEMHRDTLFRIYHRNRSQITYDKASHARKVYNTMVKEAKQSFTISKLKEHEKNQSKFWEDIKSLIPDMKSRNVDAILNPYTERLCTGNEANDLMNEYFINIGKELAEKLPPSSGNYNQYEICITNLSVFDELTKDHLLKILRKLPLSKSSGLEEISTRLLVDAFHSIPDILIKFYNFSCRNSQIPNCFKISKVTPLPKRGDITLMKNLRPISNTPLPSNILEKHVNSVIYKYMESNNLFFNHQNGFRKGKSTTRAVNNIVNQIYEYRNNGEHSIAVFLDLSKAFNCVNHDILCLKLEKVGIRGQCKQWIMEYLRNRKQYVKNGNLKSDCKTINYGIPQGSVLGPLIYLLYVNDITGCDIISDLNMFADDTAIVAHGKVLADVISQINNDVAKLTDWFNSNKLTVNLDKTRCMYYRKNAHDDCDQSVIRANGVQLEFVKNFSYLGIVLGNKLQFNDHIKNNIKKAGHKVYKLSRVRQYVNTNTALTIFKSMILPYTEYGNIFNGTCNELYKHMFQVIQNNALKLL